jgi:hypothetical protein
LGLLLIKKKIIHVEKSEHIEGIPAKPEIMLTQDSAAKIFFDSLSHLINKVIAIGKDQLQTRDPKSMGRKKS